MLREQNIETARSLKQNGMADWIELQNGNPASSSLTPDEYLGLALDAELQARRNRRRARLTSAAKLKQPDACMEGIDYTYNRGLDKAVVSLLAGSTWIDRCQHLVITGPTGTGKTYIACAIAMQAIRAGLPVLFKRTSLMLEEMEVARGDGSLFKYRQQLNRPPLLICDDMGVSKLSLRGRQDLFDIVEDRSDKGSLIVTSQLPVERWHDYLGEPTIADAIMDRIVHRAHHITLRGESVRKLRRNTFMEMNNEPT